MAKISFEGIGELVVTFSAKSGTGAGQVVKVTGAGEVGPCAAGDRFCGAVLAVEDALAAVQLGGFLSLPYSGAAISPGWVKLVANGTGGVKLDAANGTEHLVVSVDMFSSTAVVRL